MRQSIFLGGFLFPLATAGFAQEAMRAEPLPGPLKDAGTLHVADGTWSRGPEAHLGAKTLYNNDASAGFFGLLAATQSWNDEGRIPGCNDPTVPEATANGYLVQSISIAYCTPQPTGSGTTDVLLAFYELYTPCTNPSSLTPAGAFQVVGLPGAPTCGSIACWVVTLDLKGTSLEFEMDADGDGVFDDSTALDSFGWSFAQTDTSCGFGGPVLTGDPNNFPMGDGTYYQNPGLTGTGFQTQDRFYLVDAGGPAQNGCFWFGGYPNDQPFASFWLQLGGEDSDREACEPDCPCEKYCQANPSSCAAPCDLSVGLQSDEVFVLRASPSPFEPGIFFHAEDPARIPFGNGFLCATGDIVRLLPPIFPDVACGEASLEQDFADYAGMGTRHFQYWFRDPAGGGQFFNTSNAVSISF